MLYTTITQYEEAIQRTQLAIERVLVIGSKTENNSGGSSRSMEDSSLKDLSRHLSQLQLELKNFYNGGGITFGVGF